MEFSFLRSTFYLVGRSPRPVSYTQKAFFDFTVFYFLFFRGLFFLGWIWDFSFLFSTFYLVGGSPRPVSYTKSFFFRFYCFLLSIFSWVALPRMDFGF